MTVATVPALPDVSEAPAPAEVANALRSIKTTIEVREGVIASGTNSRFVTIQDLIDAGVIADGVIL